MPILNDTALESNKYLKFNFNGGDLSSDAGLIPVHEFANKIGFTDLIKEHFHTKKSDVLCTHKDADNLVQKIYQIICGYFQEDDADELCHDPVFNALLEKERLASQPTLSRFDNRMDDVCLMQFEVIQQELRQRIYSLKKPERILLDIDSTLFATYGNQIGSDYNAHYRDYGFHPLLVFDGLTGDLLQAKLRPGSTYTSNGAADFLYPLLLEFQNDYPDTDLFLRGDSGFADVILYEKLESNGVSYAIRLKENRRLYNKASFITDRMHELTADNLMDYACIYDEFMYMADSWAYPRRVVVKVEKPYGQFAFFYTFIVTNMDSSPEDIVRFYANRGTMENMIKEGKLGFHMDSMSSHNMVVNANKLQISVLAYNLFNWFKRIVLPKKMRHLQTDTIRLKLIRIAARVIHSARYTIFKLCSSCPYQKDFYQTMENIHNLKLPQLE